MFDNSGMFSSAASQGETLREELKDQIREVFEPGRFMTTVNNIIQSIKSKSFYNSLT